MSKINAVKALNVRVWAVEGGVHPTRSPIYLSLGKFATDPSHTIGESARISAPDPNNFERDISIGDIPGEEERATFSIGSRYTSAQDLLLLWKQKQCRVDFFGLVGLCANPQDFTQGGEKWVYFPDGKIGAHNFENFGAFGRDENNPTNSNVDMTAENYWEYLYMSQDQLASATTTRELRTVDTYGGDECEDCPDKCKRVLMTMVGTGATPGTQPVLLYSGDGGQTFTSEDIASMFSNESIDGAEVIGGDLVIITNTGNELHLTGIEDLYNNENTWNQVDTGFNASGAPNAISSADVRHSWIVGDNGYIYFVKNPKVKVEEQDAGVATSQHLRDVHAFSDEHVLAVGDSNAVVYTVTGGDTWASVTGPSAGVNLGACWIWDDGIWFVGEGAGGSGKLYLTENYGRTWTEVGLPASYTRIDRIKFVNEAEGFISARSGGQSYILRTITAGNEWTVLPQGKSGTAIDNSYLLDIAVCEDYSNVAYAVGLADDGSAGIALKMSG